MDDQSVVAKGDELLANAIAAMQANKAPGSDIHLSFDQEHGRIRLDLDGYHAFMSPDIARQLAHSLRKEANDLERTRGKAAGGQRRQPLRGGRGRRGRL